MNMANICRPTIGCRSTRLCLKCGTFTREFLSPRTLAISHPYRTAMELALEIIACRNQGRRQQQMKESVYNQFILHAKLSVHEERQTTTWRPTDRAYVTFGLFIWDKLSLLQFSVCHLYIMQQQEIHWLITTSRDQQPCFTEQATTWAQCLNLVLISWGLSPVHGHT